MLAVLGTSILAAFGLGGVLYGLGEGTAAMWVGLYMEAAVVAVVIMGAIRLIRWVWRRTVSRMPPVRRDNAWLVRQPWWKVALLYWACTVGGGLCGTLVVSLHWHRPPDLGLVAWTLLGNGTVSVLVALAWRARWRRQTANTPATADR